MPLASPDGVWQLVPHLAGRQCVAGRPCLHPSVKQRLVVCICSSANHRAQRCDVSVLRKVETQPDLLAVMSLYLEVGNARLQR